MVVSLAQVVGSITALTVGNWLLRYAAMWEDWGATVSAFAAFKSLQSLTLGCSVTPTPTLSTIVGCTIGCVKAAYQRRPALRTDMLLVGGLEGLRKVSTRVNLQRLQLLAPHLPVFTTVDWIIGDEDEPIVYYVGAVEDRHQDGRKTLSFKDVGTRSDHHRSKTWMEPNCLLCDMKFGVRPDIDQTTPIDALVDCSVEEVRKALAFEGTDLDAFDSRSALTGAETPFELFL
ncbi:hypothetical protein BDY24DRAFT_398098, partial [Mrakia frigida]|uniref:uncharacterized protein n=1 Tax=Mrakia frigida TaxID=29902 RepID=UPI003FCC0FA0